MACNISVIKRKNHELQGTNIFSTLCGTSAASNSQLITPPCGG
jgi:hypothetical protein